MIVINDIVFITNADNPIPSLSLDQNRIRFLRNIVIFS